MMAEEGSGTLEHIQAVLAESAEDIRLDRMHDAAEFGDELRAMIAEARQRLEAERGPRR